MAILPEAAESCKRHGPASMLTTGRGNTVTDSVVMRAFIGVLSFSAGAAVDVIVTRSVFNTNGTGLRADGANAFLRVGASVVTGNTVSTIQANGGALQSYGDNNITGNGDGDPGPVTTPKK